MANQGWAHSTKVSYARAAKRHLLWLWEHHGAKKLDGALRKYASIRPRNVTATDEERELVLNAAPPHLRLWLLLCSDLAIRSGTATILNPGHYDRHTRKLTFKTKRDESVMIPVTEEIAQLLNDCDFSSTVSFVRQLWNKNKTRQMIAYRGRMPDPHGQSATLSALFCKLRRSLGIDRKLTPHDLRRTTAVAMYEHTKDVRDVQALLGHTSLASTIWYLDHHLRPIQRATLELIKRSASARKEQTA